MKEDTFNLIERPWICLLSKDGKVKKEGLKRVFLNAQDYIDLGGEMRLQDMAVLRLLIAISVTILYRYDEKGEKAKLNDWEHSLKRFYSVWRAGKFNEKAVTDYFDSWYDRFDLFGIKHPFFQISLDGIRWIDDEDCPDGKKPIYTNGVYMNWLPIANISGRIQSSNNKPNAPYKDLFGSAAEEICYDEAARWLLFYNAYADCTVGKRQQFTDGLGKKHSANAGMTFPSRGSLITPVGHNLFETIMLNSVLFDPRRHELYESACPVWEEEHFDPEIIIDRMVPNDLARMYTQQARRISLYRRGEKVIGAFVSAGETYSSELLWMEPAFMMHEVKDKESKDIFLVPMQCGEGMDIWHEIQHIAGDKGASITRWIDILQDDGEDSGLFSEDCVIPFRMTGINYGNMNCGIQSMIEDHIILSRQFLEDTDIQADAICEIKKVDEVAKEIQAFGNNCARCMNYLKGDYRVSKFLSEQYYNAVGYEFRRYLAGEVSITELRKKEFELARKIVDLFVEKNIKLLIKGKSGEQSMHLGKAETIFNSKLLKIERK